MHVVEDIDGVTVARGLATADKCQLTLMASSGFSEGCYFPPESIAVLSVEGIAALHNLCGRLLDDYAEQSQAGG